MRSDLLDARWLRLQIFTSPRAWLASIAMAGLASCSNIQGTYPRSTPLIPAASIQFTESMAYSLEQIALGVGVAVIAYYVVDPLAPNWDIHEAKISADRYALKLKMKRFHTGGAGEARGVFHRRAAQLVRDGGYVEYQIVSYSEGIESTLPAAQRVCEGEIQLVARSQ